MTSPAAISLRESPTRCHAKPANDVKKSSQEIQPKGITKDDEIAALGPAPDGGLKAWLNAAGGFCIFFSCLGFTSCFGVLQEYYSTHQLKDHTMDQIAWIGSLASFVQFAGGVVGGPMFDRFGVWVSPNFSYHRLGMLVVKRH
jgi:hypothetical protein